MGTKGRGILSIIHYYISKHFKIQWLKTNILLFTVLWVKDLAGWLVSFPHSIGWGIWAGTGVEVTSVTCLTPHGDDLILLGLVHMAGLLSSHDVGSHVV